MVFNQFLLSLGTFGPTTQTESTNEEKSLFFPWFCEIICLGLFGSLTEREEDEVESVRDIRSVWHVFELGVMTQAGPVTTTLQSGKSASLINFQKSTNIQSFSKHSHTF